MVSMINLNDSELISQVLTPEEIAPFHRVNPNAVRKWIKEGKLRAYRVGKCLRILREWHDESKKQEGNMNETLPEPLLANEKQIEMLV